MKLKNCTIYIFWKCSQLFWRYLGIFYTYYKIRRYLKQHKMRKLNLGAGTNILDGWLNSDLFPRNKRVIFLDVTHRFPFKNDMFDYISCEHMIEHISYTKGFAVLKECYRILRPGGVIRLATPEIYFLIGLFNKEKTTIQNRYINWHIENFYSNTFIKNETLVANSFFYNFGHRFIYDFETIKNSLELAGFTDITRCEIRKSNHKLLENIELHGSMIPDEFNILETMIIEGKKGIEHDK